MDSYKPVQILLVDDNPDDVLITQRGMERSHVANTMHVARDGQEAIDFLFRQGQYGPDTPRPDLILLDVNLPKANGLEVLERIRDNRELAAIPVIMLTASDRDEDVLRSYQLGSNTYIQKPVEFEKFLHALEVFGQYWIVIAKLPNAA
ncbi:MAG: response regulator [Dehalococcoidia bacterium]